MNIASASLVRTLAAPARPSRDSSATWRTKVPSQALDWFLADDAPIAAAFDQDVVGNQVLGSGHDPRRELRGRHCLGAPGLRRFDCVEVGGVEADDAQ